MLDFMRKQTRSIGVKIIFGIISLVFVFFGVGGSGDTSPIETVATVDNRPISARAFQRAYENVKTSYQNIYKDKWTPELAQSFNLKDQTLQQLIDMQLMEAEAQQIGLTVTDDEVREAIVDLAAFQAYGEFSSERYRRLLRAYRMTPREFEDDQRTQLLTNKMRDLIVSSVHVTDAEARELFDSRQEKVDLEFIKIASADFLDAVTLEPDALETFYNTHRESFRQPERVRFTYTAYPADHFATDITVSDAEIETVYTAQKDNRFTTKERVQARHILLNVAPDAAEEDKADVRTAITALRERVKAGEDFAALAEEHSEDTASGAKGGDLGFFTRGRMVKEFEEAAFSLPVGEVSDIVETQFGFHIIKVEAKEAEQARPLEEVAEEIREELVSEQAQEKAKEAAQEDQQQIQSGATLKDLVEARGLTVVESSLLARDETVPDLGRQPQVLQAAFNTDPGSASNPVQVGETSYLILTHEKTDSLIPDFADVKDEAENRYKSEQAELLAKEKAEVLLSGVKESKSLTQVVEQEAAEREGEEAREIEETGAFARQGGYIPKIGSLPAMKKAAFRLTPENPVVPEVYMWGGNAFVAVLFEHIPASPDEFEKQKETIRTEILNQKRAGAGNELIQYLKKQATIEMNQEALLRITT